ncbi:helix-turn-helix domain-containing protein [Sphaerisporangium sp. NPDC005289]|uniref:helix-turn-helix domain-containing protein n=1 Tax=Sphaerisporangium sp. NPDC005289 TaxID=3155247 RepID=UPI0033A4AA2C
MTALPVPADLTHLVAATWVLDGDTVPRGLPHPTVDLLVMPDGACRLAGPETRGRQGALPEGGPLVGVRLRPGTVTGLFGVAADEVPLTGASLEVGRLGGAATERLGEAATEGLGGSVSERLRGSVSERLRGALALVRARARAGRCQVDERVLIVLAAMHAEPGAPVDRHAARAGLSGRHLRRRFGVAVGLRPKSYVRVVRLHHALAAARVAVAKGERPDWADIAVRSGCYDQSHLLAEFRHAVGAPPATLLPDVRFLQAPAGRGPRHSTHG